MCRQPRTRAELPVSMPCMLCVCKAVMPRRCREECRGRVTAVAMALHPRLQVVGRAALDRLALLMTKSVTKVGFRAFDEHDAMDFLSKLMLAFPTLRGNFRSKSMVRRCCAQCGGQIDNVYLGSAGIAIDVDPPDASAPGIISIVGKRVQRRISLKEVLARATRTNE